MNNLIQYFWNNKKIFFVAVFAVAFAARCIITYKTPAQNRWIDLNIYVDGGQLISNKINPYNFNDSPEIRNKLRTDSTANGWQCETQDRWNFYAGGNLPMTLLFFGALDSISTGNALLYRLAFSFFDSVLSALIVLFCIRFWKLKPSVFNVILILGLSAFAPMLLLNGTAFPEDKGIQTLLMIASVYFAMDRKWMLSAILLGASISFKGLGVFILPLSLFYAIGSPGTWKLNTEQIKTGTLYIAVALFTCALFFVPFLPEVITMMKVRMSSNLISAPGHSSIWLFFYKFFPAHWELIKNIFLACFTGGFLFIFFLKKVNIPLLCTSALVLFTLIILLNGSVDRMNIAIMFATLMVGMTDLSTAKIMVWYSIVAGGIIFSKVFFGNINEELTSLYCLGYVLLFFYFMIRQLSQPSYKTIQTN